MRKYLILTVLIGFFLIIGAGCKNKIATKSTIDTASLEDQMQTLLANEQQLKTEAGRLADQGQIKNSLAKFNTLIANYNQAKQINKTITDNVTSNKEYYDKRDELLVLAIDMFEKAKSCVSLINEGQKSSENKLRWLQNSFCCKIRV